MTRKANCEKECSKYKECRAEFIRLTKIHNIKNDDYNPYRMLCSAGPCVSEEEYIEYMKELEKFKQTDEYKKFKNTFSYL